MFKKKKPFNYLGMLEELTNALPPVPSLYDIVSGPGLPQNYRIVVTEAGESLKEWGLFKHEKGSVSLVKGEAGAISKEHAHNDAVEYYIVLTGKVQSFLRFDAVHNHTARHTGTIGDVLCIPKGIPHKCKVHKDSLFVVVTVPGAAGMPSSPTFKGVNND